MSVAGITPTEELTFEEKIEELRAEAKDNLETCFQRYQDAKNEYVKEYAKNKSSEDNTTEVDTAVYLLAHYADKYKNRAKSRKQHIEEGKELNAHLSEDIIDMEADMEKMKMKLKSSKLEQLTEEELIKKITEKAVSFYGCMRMADGATAGHLYVVMVKILIQHNGLEMRAFHSNGDNWHERKNVVELISKRVKELKSQNGYGYSYTKQTNPQQLLHSIIYRADFFIQRSYPPHSILESFKVTYFMKELKEKGYKERIKKDEK